MTKSKDSIFERFLAPLFHILLDQPELQSRYAQTDWTAARERWEDLSLVYPSYYQNQTYHSIAQGYLSPEAAVTYDPITEWVIVPHEAWVRQSLIDRVQGWPRRILDLGCGTGTQSLMLKQAFPSAQVTGIDLSPYMLFMAEHKAQQAHQIITWKHGDVQHVSLEANCFDVITAALLFHETPPSVTQQILREAFRLLTPGGQILILDANQETLRGLPWLQDLFEEPYIEAYASGWIEDWLELAGFVTISTENQWWASQLTWAMKPLPSQSRTQSVFVGISPDERERLYDLPSYPLNPA
ncbi:methyltransferase domain-containing protein [Synechococcales cyanobacterium C]|uniref:Methyltransferase domain-containing protein n=1 Tax=Petrachloros mirabilis ULC683 TaxID=2781853 RepID=A0A8K2A7T8_9CYAN|nr:class I SAM-dependent methyltransferase [Petrachloros mirabilis]NCJ06430.1 methyltransferase domain-containing protein [Petrachloros mirabilis ULC683]